MAKNAETYAEQAFRVLDREKTKVRYNGEWLSELSLLDLIRLGQNFTVQQFLVRDNFAKRLESGEPILPARDLLCPDAGLRRRCQ